MATPINMPQVGQDLETAKIVEWHVKVGDYMNKGDVIATVESDKASFEVETFQEGTVLKILFEEGEEGAVFKPIAYIGDPGENVSEGEPEDAYPEEKKNEATLINDQPTSEATSIKDDRIFSSPSARRVATEHCIDIKQVKPTGPDNRVIKKDVLAFAATLEPVRATPLAREIARAEGIKLSDLNGTGPSGRIHKADVLNAVKKSPITMVADKEDEMVPFDKVRKIIAERLSLSKQTIPHYYLNIVIDVENVLVLKDKLRDEPGISVSFNDILVQVIAKVLARYKLLNAHVDHEKVIIRKNINIGIAVSTDAGLFVPVLPQADKKTLVEIASEIRKLAEDARRGIVNPANQGTFTVSNLGMFGISGFQAIINPPECAILSLGGIEKKVVPNGNTLKITDTVTIGMAVDHRAVDGAYAAKFLNELKTELTNISK